MTLCGLLEGQNGQCLFYCLIICLSSVSGGYNRHNHKAAGELETLRQGQRRETESYDDEEYLHYEDTSMEAGEGNGEESAETNFRHLNTHNEQKQSLIPKLFGYLKNALVPTKSKIQENVMVDSQYSPSDYYEDFDGEFEDEAILEDYAVHDDPEDSGIHLENGRTMSSNLRNVTDGRRNLPVYLFQGQYLAEPRLNRFIDGAMENLEREMKVGLLDPLYFRILPRGRVIGRPKPIKRFAGITANNRRKRRPFRRGIRNRRRRRPLVLGRNQNFENDDETGRQSRRKPGAKPPVNRKAALSRGVGGGRVEGLSRIARDGDAEMQLFGNYTLIRSHYNAGPIDMVMQFRTIRGLRRAAATLDKVKIHTVTRVNTQGCEMIDFLLDRAHAETIQIRGQLFPLANRVAKNIFSRLFAPESFLVARVREKTGLALLSKKASF